MSSPEKEQWEKVTNEIHQRKKMADVPEQNSALGNKLFYILLIVGVVLLIGIGVTLFMTLGKNEPQQLTVTYAQNEIVDQANFDQNIKTICEQGAKEEKQKRFKSSVFVGDSLTEGLGIYGYVKTKNMVAQKGVNILFATKQVKKIAKKNPKHIFIMLGINDLNNRAYSQADIEKNYRKFIKKLHKACPDANIYVQSLLPVTAKYEKAHKNLKNKRINQMNKKLKSMCKDYKYVTYVNIHKLYANKKGCLPSKLSSDGYHLIPKGYNKWVDYIKHKMK